MLKNILKSCLKGSSQLILIPIVASFFVVAIVLAIPFGVIVFLGYGKSNVLDVIGSLSGRK